MNPRVCICCGEPIGEKSDALSRNPNLCASCSSLADGSDEAEFLLLTGPRATESRNTPGAPSTAQPVAAKAILGRAPTTAATKPTARA